MKRYNYVSRLVVIFIILFSEGMTGQQDSTQGTQYVGEIQVALVNNQSNLVSFSLDAIGPVWGMSGDNYPLIDLYRHVSITTSALAVFQFLGRGGGADSVKAFSYGYYALSVPADGATVYVDFRDCDYQSVGSSHGYGLHYSHPDMQLTYDASNHIFKIQDAVDSTWRSIGSENGVGIWQDHHKDSLSFFPPVRNCLAIPIAVENVFLLSIQDTARGKNLVADDDIVHPVASGDTIKSWLYGTTHSLRPDSNRYGSIEAPFTHRFMNWGLDHLDIQPTYQHVVGEPTRLHDNFVISLSSRISTERMP